MDPIRAGIAFMIAGVMLVPVGDAFAKEIARATDIPPSTVAWTRFVIGAALFLPLALLSRDRPALTWRIIGAQVLRGALVAGGIFCMVTAVSFAPLAEVFGAFFIAPAVSTALAVWVLGERPARLDLVSLALGLVGVALVTRPGAEMNIGLVWGLAAGVLYGAFNAATRWSAAFAPPRTQIAGQLLVGAILLAPLGAAGLGAVGQAPLLVLGSGLASAVANFLLTLAYARASAGVLAPIIYLQLLSASAIGMTVFDETPDMLASIGLFLIFTAGFVLKLMVRRG